jgi:biopolymer transport protein ExbB
MNQKTESTPFRHRTPSRLLSRLAAFALLLLPALIPLHAQDADAAPAAPPAQDQSLLDLYLQGGPLMHVIALCSIGTIAVATFCGIRINRRKLIPPASVAKLGQLMERRDVQGAYSAAQASGDLLSKTLEAALLKFDPREPKNNRDAMEKAAAEKLSHEETRLNLWVNYLNVFATVAPMIGLLGTVTGMIEAFNALAAGKSEPSDLAGGIGQAMLTTAGGLIVGIPAMFCFFFFRNVLHGVVADTEVAILKMLDALNAEAPQPEEPPFNPEHAEQTHVG